MIQLHGSYQRTFTFPADKVNSFHYYSDFDRTLRYLPHISIVKRYQPDQYRLLYSTIELGIYRVRIFCDLKVEANLDQLLLRISPLDGGIPPVRPEAGLYSLTSQGSYSSLSQFYGSGPQASIDYNLQLSLFLPIPLGMRLIPEPVLESIASSITNWRIREIAEGFIERSIQAYTA